MNNSVVSRYRSLMIKSWKDFFPLGTWSLWRHVLRWSGVYRCLVIYGYPLIREQESARISIKIGELSADQLDEYAVLRPDADLQSIRHRLILGHSCTVARLLSGELIAACWNALDHAFVDFLGCEIEFGKEAVYIYDQFVSKQYRRLGVSEAIESYTHIQMRDLGIVLNMTAIWPGNHIAVRRMKKRTSRFKIGVIRSYRIVGWQWHRISLYPSKDAVLLRLVSST